MQTFLFRSRELIVESDEADLVRDVSLDIDKAQTKLESGNGCKAYRSRQPPRCSSSPRRKPSWPRRSLPLYYRPGQR
jgi:hypothetical protein